MPTKQYFIFHQINNNNKKLNSLVKCLQEREGQKTMWIKRNDREKMNEGNILFPPHHYYLSLFISSNINFLHFRNITIFYFPPLHFVTLDTVTFKNPNFLILLPFKNSSKLPLAFCCCSVAQSCLTLQSHGLQHSSLPCPSLPLKVC